MNIPESLAELIATGPLVHFTTLNADGSPQVTLVWVGIEHGEFVSAHLAERQKVRNVRRDPRVALSFLGAGTNSIGLREYAVVKGEARITEGGAAELLQRLARTYIGPDAEFPPPGMRDVAGFIIRVRPVRFGGVGPWVQG